MSAPCTASISAGHRASFIVPVGAPGVTTVCRKIAARDPNPFVSPLLAAASTSSTARCGSTTCSSRGSACSWSSPRPSRSPAGCCWHHLYGWLAKAEFTLGLALALADAMGLKEHEPTVEYLVDLVAEVQTVRTCLAAAERDPEFTPAGYCVPKHRHLRPAASRCSRRGSGSPKSCASCRAPRWSWRRPTAISPTRRWRRASKSAFGGGGYTALQRAALLQLASDHVSSALDGREIAFELHASGGIPAWRGRLRRSFPRYNELANAVLRAIDMPMPEIDVGSIPAAPLAPRRVTTPPPGKL